MAVTQQEIESRLWDAADELRVAMPEAQYSSVMFPLMFWKYLSDTWEHHHQEFLAENEGLDALSAEEALEIEYRDYQSFEISRSSTAARSGSGAPRGRRSSRPSPGLASASGSAPRCRPSRTANPDKVLPPVRVDDLDGRRGGAVEAGRAGVGHAGDGPRPEDARGQHVPRRARRRVRVPAQAVLRRVRYPGWPVLYPARGRRAHRQGHWARRASSRCTTRRSGRAACSSRRRTC